MTAAAAVTEDPDAFISDARRDWLMTGSWNRLHAVRDGDWTDGHREDMGRHWAVLRPVRLACGRTAASARIPGPFSRAGAMRCAGCCRAMGFPQGKGSPGNDGACRVLLGLPAADAALMGPLPALTADPGAQWAARRPGGWRAA